MLTRFDDYPIHQVPEPVAHPASSDRNVYDRYWFNGYPKDGSFYFGIAMGLYPNRNVQDCGFSIVRDGEQHSFHGSRRAPGEPSDLNVGPFRIEVLEPMRSLRVILEPNETGISAELKFTARTACVEEGRQTIRQDSGRVVFDVTRFGQYGHWEGEIRYGGRSLPIDSAQTYGTKDRSWGIRPVGEPETGGPPMSRLPQFYFAWSPINWPDKCTHFGVMEHEDGHAWHQDGAILPVYDDPTAIPGVKDPGTRKMAAVAHDIVYASGTRRASAARVTLVERNGTRHVMELEPLLPFRMKGIGYSHPEWGHGRWKGELAIAGESWKTDDLNELAMDTVHIQQLVRAKMDGQEGIGALEQMCIGPHAPSGFTQFLDGAP
jgi:hypothetical protein